MKTLIVAAAAACLAVVACTVNSTTTNNGVSAACNADTSVVCPTGATGYTCSGGQTPQATDSSLDCGSGTADGSNTDYCCITLTSGTTCSQDSTVQGCQGGSYGFSCTGTDTPDQADSSLNCSTGTPGNNETLYCCYIGGTPPDGGTDTCMQDSTVTCTGNAQGWSCTGSDTPDQDQSGLVCSTGTAGSGNTEYCCISYSSSTCMQDSTVQGCQGGSYGFSCTGSDTPEQSDSSLNCSTGTAGSNGETLYCCTD
jgi:hypothetical protein